MDKLEAGVEGAFAVFPQAPALVQPSERAFDHPTLGDDGEGVQFVALGDLDGGPQLFRHGIGKGLPRIAAVHQDTVDPSQVADATVERGQRAFAVGDIGGGDGHRMGQPLAVHGDVPLDARHLLARVVALFARAVTVLHALGVDHQKGGPGLPPLAAPGRAHLIFLRPAPGR